MKNKNKKLAFTFVELIITSVIIIIISTIGFYSYSKHIGNSKDSERVSNMVNLSSGLKDYKQNKGIYPLPSDYFTLTNSGTELVKQGKIDKSFSLASLNKIPFDPSTDNPYLYGITLNKEEYQIASTLENNGTPIALVEGDYKSVSKNILPSLLIAYNGTGNIDISKEPFKNKFILNGFPYNLPYNLENGTPFSASGVVLSSILIEQDEKIWQNIDYKSCEEICNAGKSLGDGEYQILTNTGGLINIICDFDEGGSCENESTLSANFCVNPKPTNANINVGIPTMSNQSWQNTNPNNPCYFTCKAHYTWNGINCIADTQIFTCGAKPENTSWNSINSYTQTWDGSNWMPSDSESIYSTTTTTSCHYVCSSGYSWDGSNCIVSGTLISGPCTNLPSNTLYYNNSSNYSLVDAPTGTSLDALSAGYSSSPDDNTCQFKCNSGYSWNGSNCELDTPDEIKEIFADESEYSNNWNNNTCSPDTMNVINILPGTNTIPNTLNENTIYKLINGNYITTNPIEIGGDCVGLIGEENTIIYSNSQLENGVITAYGRENSIISNISVDNESNGAGGNHDKNRLGTYFEGLRNSTFKNIKIYNSYYKGIRLHDVDISTFENLQIYNSGDYGIFFRDSDKNTFNNIQTYNNQGLGIGNDGGEFNTFNNIQSYNNNYGLILHGLQNSIISNVHAYNNYYTGIDFAWSNNNSINNTYIYNNYVGVNISESYNNKYYGDIKMFGNDYIAVGTDGNDSFLSSGNSSENIPSNAQLGSSLDFGNGAIITLGLSVTCNYHSNPNIVISWGINCLDRGRKTSGLTTPVTNYLYGNDILKQNQPIKYNISNSLFEKYGSNGNEYDTNKYIGEF
ncbi:hypothetical protein HGA92_02915 [Candidatus Gracilibacteria bacterium]|nr:hypothetical protein [Candidatus Gracilibacteria bacterium]NUJ98368.1 hypothetical protein [Candidatus Gracilibacteria bacterium]